MRVGSLFSGIGGIDLGLERAGMEVRWQCEINPYCRKVLAKHWPDIPCYDDVRNLPDDIEPVDLICGGYPCQPFSLAGARRGEDDPRHLWPAFAGALRLLRPEWALLENVPGHLSLGFGDVLADLAALGYDTEWTCIPAAAVGAPHLRWRLFVVAHSNGEGESGEPVDAFTRSGVLVPNAESDTRGVGYRDGQADVPDTISNGIWDQPVAQPWCDGASVAYDDGASGSMAHATGRTGGPLGAVLPGDGEREFSRTTGGRRSRRPGRGSGTPRAMAHAICAGPQGPESERTPGWPGSADGGWWATEPDVGRVANGVPSRVDRLRALGNAVVPQVAEFVGRRIMTQLNHLKVAQ